jgi:hypothetical protein
MQALSAGHFNSFRQYEPGLIGIGTQPSFAIGQRALLICTPHGNILWDCIAMLDAATVALARSDMLVSVTRGAAHMFAETAPLVCVELPFSVPTAEFRLVWNRPLHHSPGHAWLHKLLSIAAGQYSRARNDIT